MMRLHGWLFNVQPAWRRHQVQSHFSLAAWRPSDKAMCLVIPKQVGQDVWAQFGQEVQLRRYDACIPYLKELNADLQARSIVQKVLIGEKTSAALAEAIGLSSINIVRAVAHRGPRSYQNATEIEGFRASHIRDRATLVRYFAWLEEQLTWLSLKQVARIQITGTALAMALATFKISKVLMESGPELREDHLVYLAVVW
ncbi:hypothetical protein V8E53_015003 [Lactarius tabidus]